MVSFRYQIDTDMDNDDNEIKSIIIICLFEREKINEK